MFSFKENLNLSINYKPKFYKRLVIIKYIVGLIY